ncbi:MAG: HigA family addiction module antidote protein [Alphaproteobacteria bacterium]|nr:HigA family addiction module antidote protein [Alphaproteobacteria bacterium]
MAEYKVRLPLKRPPTHPGALMREILEEHVKVPIAEAARRMKVSRQSLYAVLNGASAVTADMAVRFAKLTGGTPELFVQMQANYDLWHAQARLKVTLARIKPAA